MPKPRPLTPSMRDGLVLAGGGLLRGYRGHDGEARFAQGKTAHMPHLNAPHFTGRALLAADLIRLNPETHLCDLTPRGRELFEAHVRPQECDGIERYRREVARAREYAASRDRKAAWLAETAEERRAWATRGEEIWRERRMAKERIEAIAWELARGANDVDGLLAELRALGAKHDAAAAALDEHEKARPRFEDGSHA